MMSKFKGIITQQQLLMIIAFFAFLSFVIFNRSILDQF